MYSFTNVTVIFDGRIITGYSDDNEVKIAANEDSVFNKVGVDGAVTYAANPNKSGVATFSLFQTSASLPALRAAAKAAKQATLTIRDATADTGFLLQQDNCVVQKIPDYVRGKEPSKIEVSIFVPKLDIVE